MAARALQVRFRQFLPQARSLTFIGRFNLQAAELQALCFHLFLPRTDLIITKLQQMYDLACCIVETAEHLQKEESLSDGVTAFTGKFVHLASCVILKLIKSPIRDHFDLDRGRRAYFSAINLWTKFSIEPRDIAARAAQTLTQLWTSKHAFKQPNGDVDSLSLCCTNRQAMCVVYDCYWW